MNWDKILIGVRIGVAVLMLASIVLMVQNANHTRECNKIGDKAVEAGRECTSDFYSRPQVCKDFHRLRQEFTSCLAEPTWITRVLS